MNKRNLHIILYVCLLLSLLLYDMLGGYLNEIARITYQVKAYWTFMRIFPYVYSMLLYVRFYFSMGSDYKKPVLARVIFLVPSVLCAVYGFHYWKNGYFIGAFFVMECLCEFIPLLKRKKG